MKTVEIENVDECKERRLGIISRKVLGRVQ